MKKRSLLILFSVIVFMFSNIRSVIHAEFSTTATTSNESYSTFCAEEDNVNIPFYGNIAAFIIEVTHPVYDIEIDNCTADFSNCPPPEPGYSFTPGIFKLFDDGETVIEAVREAEWWQQNGMEVSVDAGSPETDIHYLRVYRKIEDANEWPQYLVLYMDGNLRLIPHPPLGITNVCFGSSVIIGPAETAQRPIAEIISARYISNSNAIEIFYREGGSAVIGLKEINRTIARLEITVNYPTDIFPFATFRSMFVESGNSDVDHVTWKDPQNELHDDPIMAFPGGDGTEWFFYRSSWSKHNTSAPDIRIKIAPVPSTAPETLSPPDSTVIEDGDDCVIATAAYGSHLASQVKILQQFRDNFLMTNKIGKVFIRLYYKYSPEIAEFIKNNDSVRTIVRTSLLPIVGLTWVALKIGLIPTLILLFLFTFSLIRLGKGMRRLRN